MAIPTADTPYPSHIVNEAPATIRTDGLAWPGRRINAVACLAKPVLGRACHRHHARRHRFVERFIPVAPV